MKISKISDSEYKVYIYNYELNKDTFDDDIKKNLKLLQKRLHLKGFYKVIAYYMKYGLFLDIILLEESKYKNTIDFRIIRGEDDIYFKTKDYFIISNSSLIKYYDGYYYGLVDDSFDEVLEKVEYGDFIIGCDLKKAIII